jgi:hypothetical protein
MKTAATLLTLVLASCAMDSAPETATTEDHATIVPAGLPQVDTSCQWIPTRNCYGMPNDGNNIWPANMGITRVQVLVRSGPDRLEHTRRTFLAFVVWNQSVVGRIFRIDTDTPDADDWRAKLGDIEASRSISNLNADAGSSGNPVASPNPPPHPNVVGPITFDSTYLDTVRRYANVIDNATDGFLGLKAGAID